MKVKIKDRRGFDSVFGAESFLKWWPELETTGVEVKELDGWFYIVDPTTGRRAHDSAFFTEGDMKHLEVT